MKTQKGFAVLEALLILIITIAIGATGWYVWSANKKANPVTKLTSQTSTKPEQEPNSPKDTSDSTKTHTSSEAVQFVQETYDTYLSTTHKANDDYHAYYARTHEAPKNFKPVALVGLESVKSRMGADVYTQAASKNNAEAFSCTEQYVTDKYSATLKSSSGNTALVAVSISNGGGLSTEGMVVTVDLSSLLITRVTCPQ